MSPNELFKMQAYLCHTCRYDYCEVDIFETFKNLKQTANRQRATGKIIYGVENAKMGKFSVFTCWGVETNARLARTVSILISYIPYIMVSNSHLLLK